MKRGFVGAILAGVCVVLGVAVAYVSSKQDRTDPVITVSEDALTYTEGEGTEGLLTGVTATDKEDGDLTKDIFVEKVVPISENKAIVYYGVLDESQNVGTATKEVEIFRQDNSLRNSLRRKRHRQRKQLHSRWLQTGSAL